MNVDLAAKRVADKFVKNTDMKNFDPMWIVALVQVIIYVIKYCDEKKDLNNFKGAVQLAMSPLRRYVGTGRRVRAALRKAVSANLAQANSDEMLRAILETASEANDEEILGLVKSVGDLDHNP